MYLLLASSLTDNGEPTQQMIDETSAQVHSLAPYAPFLQVLAWLAIVGITVLLVWSLYRIREANKLLHLLNIKS